MDQQFFAHVRFAMELLELHCGNNFRNHPTYDENDHEMQDFLLAKYPAWFSPFLHPLRISLTTVAITFTKFSTTAFVIEVTVSTSPIMGRLNILKVNSKKRSQPVFLPLKFYNL